MIHKKNLALLICSGLFFSTRCSDLAQSNAALTFYMASDLSNYQAQSCRAVKMGTSILLGNNVCSTDLVDKVNIEKVVHFFDEAPFRWVLTGEQNATIGHLLKQYGLIHSHSYPGLSITLDSFNYQPAHPRISVERMDETNRQQWLSIVSSAFFIEYKQVELFLDYIEAAATEVVLYVGSWEDEPVSAGMALYHGDTISVHQIATLQEARGKGMAKALINVLLKEGKERGAKKAVLASSDIGKPLYLTLGFSEYELFDVWIYDPQGLSEEHH
jgi:GNAT superfamily N-acetyltransferase